MKTSKIFLVGYMGSGKTTIGKQWADALGYAFVDLDDAIVKAAGKSIPLIFAQEGEQAFREREVAALKKTGGLENVVVATGGGAPCQGDNMAWMKQNGTVYFLDVAEPELIRRLVNDAANRPLIANKTPQKLQAFVQRQLRLRRPFYEQADVRLTSEEEINKALKGLQ